VLHWQLKKWLNNCSLKTRITFVSIVGHLCSLFLLFFLYRDNEQYHILITGTMINTDVPIVFLPMHKSLKQMSGIKNNSATSAFVSKSPEIQEIAPIKKSTIAKALPEIKAKKNAKKKKVQEVKILRQAQDELNKKKKLEEKKVIKAEKKVEEKIKPVEKTIEAQKPINNMQTTENSSANVAAETAIHAEPVEAQNVLYVGQQEMDSLQMQDYIQQEMAAHWSPPAGMRKDISCIIKVIIGFDGIINKIDIEQPSGVLIFDGAAKRAVSQLSAPQWAYGKEIVLTFKP
jgi:outer membrane biosynthesis protein TonB